MRNVHIFTYDKTILRFLFFVIWPILYSKFLENLPNYHQKWPHFFVPKDAQCSETYAKLIFRFFIF